MALEMEARPVLAQWRHVLRTCTPPEGRVGTVARWLVVTRACVQPMTLTAGAVAGLLAARSSDFTAGPFLLAALGLILAHAANNMINDFFDFEEGLDTADYPRALYAPHPVLEGVVSRGQLLRAILLVNALDAAIMVTLAVIRGWGIVAFALGGLFISVFYVAPPLRLKAHGLGEPGVFLVWGPLMIGGTYLAATGHVTAEVMWASVPYALLVASVLFGKHIDKLPWDEPRGMRTLPVILGDALARRVAVGLMASFYLFTLGLIAAGIYPVWTLAIVLGVPLTLKTFTTYGEPKPDSPPEGYPVWPLWFVSWAFVHARRAGALLVLGLALGLIWPVAL